MGLATSDAKPLNPPVPNPTLEVSPKGDERSLQERRAYGTDWCFDAGAPMSGSPVLGAEGQVYVATNEGYVHALNEEGAFRWSYTVKGSVIGGPQVLPGGSVVVATNRGLLYALKPNGTRHWVFRVPEPISTEVSASPRGTLVFGAADRVLYAVSRHGGVLWRAPIKGGFSAPPEVVAEGLVALGTSRGVLLVRGPNRQKLVAAPGVRQLTEGPKSVGYGWALATTGVIAFSGQRPSDLPDLRALGYDPALGQLVGVSASEALWLDAQGQISRRVRLPEAANEGVTLDAKGSAYVPTNDGWLLWATPADDEFRELARLGSSPLSLPVVDEGRRRVIAAAGEGLVCAVSLPESVSESGG